jgi:hypothetical protein
MGQKDKVGPGLANKRNDVDDLEELFGVSVCGVCGVWVRARALADGRMCLCLNAKP